ncbi:MAG: glucose-6-phosphate isomerase, partial [Dehalococcoidia bacterium]
MAEQTQQSAVALGDYAADVAALLEHAEAEKLLQRIWSGDHTVWNQDPTEIANRLGWLHVIPEMRSALQDLQAFSAEVRQTGYRQVVLLGMGGSSLGPEVMRQILGGPESHPELLVLDSTVPNWISWVDAQIKPSSTLFLVSSKSGGTIEPNSLYKYYRQALDKAVGPSAAGGHFAAVTDSGTSLEKLAEDHGFRRAFLNREDIGGRYSVLSHFGLVPAVLAGMDVDRLLESAEAMAASCGAKSSAPKNPGAWLGAFMAATAQRGRDKLTLITSPPLAAFGLWAEQLIAESTGKGGKGIVPVAGEPLMDADAYGDDRAFVYLRLENADNASSDVAMERLAAAGHPVVRLDLREKHDIGAEFFRWEFATAVAGAFLGINPFDQPNVQAAKDVTGKVLKDYTRRQALPELPAHAAAVADLLKQAKQGDYLALMVYAQPTDGVEALLSELRRQVMGRHRIAT